MARALVTGSQERTSAVVAAFARLDITAAVAHEPASIAAAVDGQTIDYYVQLPWAVALEGERVVTRVRHFLASGLLARFVAVEQVLDHLAPGASVLLVAGHQPGHLTAPDDREARRGLLDVLAHAIRTDQGAHDVRVQVASIEGSPGELVRLATERSPAPSASPRRGSDAELSYADWRTEILGLATVEV